MENERLALEAVGLTLRTRRGHVYGPIDLTLRDRETAMLVGASGSGRTALLLTLGGRMRASSGSLRIAGVDALKKPAAARRNAAFGVIAGVNDLPDALTIRDAAHREAVLLNVTGSERAVARVFDLLEIGLDLGTKISELNEADRELVSLAFAMLGDPAVVLMDDVDKESTPTERRRLLEAMAAVAAAGTCVIGACTDPQTAVWADVVIPLTAGDGMEVTEYAFAQSR